VADLLRMGRLPEAWMASPEVREVVRGGAPHHLFGLSPDV
jgi:hypothetical protein